MVALGNKEHVKNRQWEPRFNWDFISSNEVGNTAYALQRIRSAQFRNRDASRIAPARFRNSNSLLLRKVGIPKLRRAIPELSVRVLGIEDHIGILKKHSITV